MRRLPLFKITGSARKGSTSPAVDGLELCSSVDVPVRDLPEDCYALKLTQTFLPPPLTSGSIAVFARAEGRCRALENIYLVGTAGHLPKVCKVIARKDEDRLSGAGSPANSKINIRRKSFMTPTPLHIPESRVSPIPESAHEMVFLKNPREGEGIQVIPAKDVLWMHPLVYIAPTHEIQP